MVEKIQYRWDFIGLSTDTKPTPETNDRVANGSTFYCSDNSKLYVWYKDQWYEKTVSGGGGGGGSYVAGDGIDIINDTISVDTDTIQEKLTAGSNVSISSDNVISATDTTYSNFTGTDGTAAGASGLVPAPATTDAGKFLKADGTWDTAGGGGGDTVYSTKTTSNSSSGGAVYIGNLDASQEEQPDPTTTDNHYRYFYALPYDNPTSAQAPKNGCINILGECKGEGSVVLGFSAYDGNNNYYQTVIGQGAHSTQNSTVAIGYSANAAGENSVAIGRGAQVTDVLKRNSVALGAYAQPSRRGEVNIGTGGNNLGYDNTDYRILGGVHDGQLAQDAATVAQVNATIDAINTALSTNIPHIGAAS